MSDPDLPGATGENRPTTRVFFDGGRPLGSDGDERVETDDSERVETDGSERVETDGETGPDRDDGGVGGRIRSLLYAGEEPRAAVPVADGYLVATTHRLLVYTPRDDGANLEVVHGPNATAISHDASGNAQLLQPIVYTVGGGLLLVVLGTMLNVQGMSDAVPSMEGGGGVGVGSILAQIASLLSLVGLLDELMAVAGALALLVGTALTGAYLYTRRSEVVVRVAGESDLRIAAGSTTERETEAFAEEAGVDYSPPSFRRS